jgi:hypothetical protein
MIRAKNERSMWRRCDRVLADRTGPFWPGRSASQTVKSSMSSRVTAAMAVTSVLSSSQKANWRSAIDAASMLRGARNVELWVR